jgi:hypothetical protein
MTGAPQLSSFFAYPDGRVAAPAHSIASMTARANSFVRAKRPALGSSLEL